MNNILSFFYKVKYKVNQYFEGYILKKPEAILALDFIKQDKIKDFRHNYSLKNKPIIFDCGAYKGEWTNKMYEKYKHLDPNFYCFEVVEEFVCILKNKFTHNTNVKIFPYGLGLGNHSITFEVSDIATSTFSFNDNSKLKEGKIIDFMEFVCQNSISEIDLLKMNIEGGEYELLENIILSNFVENCVNIQIQFHNYGQWCVDKRDKIKVELAKTHKLTYDFDWTFENWERKVL